VAKKASVSKQSPARQAEFVMKEVAQVGTSRKENADVRGASIGALNDYRNHWQDIVRWQQEVHRTGSAPEGFPTALHRMDVAAATQYLTEKAGSVRQSQLDQARQSLGHDQPLFGSKGVD
jgi:hypothetical protein